MPSPEYRGLTPLFSWSMSLWLPEMIRDRPSAPLVLRWLVDSELPPRPPDETVPVAARHAGVSLVGAGAGWWALLVPWHTLVYGVVRRDVDERARLELGRDGDDWELRLTCLPVETHAAHAAGAAGVALLSAAAWLVGGWSGGLLPALATGLAGGMWTDATRVMAVGRLELRLRRLLEDVGTALWPDAPARLLPPPARPSL